LLLVHLVLQELRLHLGLGLASEVIWVDGRVRFERGAIGELEGGVVIELIPHLMIPFEERIVD
jgi:hypothetical protein